MPRLPSVSQGGGRLLRVSQRAVTSAIGPAVRAATATFWHFTPRCPAGPWFGQLHLAGCMPHHTPPHPFCALPRLRCCSHRDLQPCGRGTALCKRRFSAARRGRLAVCWRGQTSPLLALRSFYACYSCRGALRGVWDNAAWFCRRSNSLSRYRCWVSLVFGLFRAGGAGGGDSGGSAALLAGFCCNFLCSEESPCAFLAVPWEAERVPLQQ